MNCPVSDHLHLIISLIIAPCEGCVDCCCCRKICADCVLGSGIKVARIGRASRNEMVGSIVPVVACMRLW
jgi:hypothetical protein